MKYGLIFLLLGGLVLICGWMVDAPAAHIVAGYCAIGFFAIGTGYLLKLDAIWMKRRTGTLNPLSFALYLPLHLLIRLSFRLATFKKKYPPRHEIAPNLWLGRRPSDSEAKAMLDHESWAVVDLTTEFAEPKVLRQGKYLCLPTLDHTAPTSNQVEEALHFIAKEKPAKKVLVHCALGHGRSATIVAAWLLQNGLAKTAKEAEYQLRQIRSGVHLKDSQLSLLDKMFPQTIHERRNF